MDLPTANDAADTAVDLDRSIGYGALALVARFNEFERILRFAFVAADYGLAERYFRDAVEKAPRGCDCLDRFSGKL
jgi:hypothetical protein